MNQAPSTRWLDADEQHTAQTQLAALVAAHYFDPEAANRIAEQLSASPPVGDGVNATDFAEQLTTILRNHDGHLRVWWGPWQPRRRRETTPSANVPALELRRSDDVGIVTVRLFDNADAPEPHALATGILQQLADTRAVILDVRDVPGGWPSMVELLIGAFIGNEPVHVLTFRSRQESSEAWSRPYHGPSWLHRVPLFVTVDRGTTSAAESLAYALQSLGRATIVGTRTAGAANPGKPFETDSGFTILVPTASPLDPRTLDNWEGRGVIPDVVVETDILDHAIALATSDPLAGSAPASAP